MNVSTRVGLKVDSLPECGRCRLTGKSPKEMDACPICNFDDYGDECVPELCNEYTEEW